MSQTALDGHANEDMAEERKHDVKTAFVRLGRLYSFTDKVTHGRMDEYMECARLMNEISTHPSKYW